MYFLRRIRNLCTKDSRIRLNIRLLGRTMFRLLAIVFRWAWMPVGLLFICLDRYATMVWTYALPFSVWLQLDARCTNREETQIAQFFYFHWSCTSIMEFMVGKLFLFSVLSNNNWHTITPFAVKEIALQNLLVIPIDSWLNARN